MEQQAAVRPFSLASRIRCKQGLNQVASIRRAQHACAMLYRYSPPYKRWIADPPPILSFIIRAAMVRKKRQTGFVPANHVTCL
jgi:hypothetical protein